MSMALPLVVLYLSLQLHGLFEIPLTGRVSLRPWIAGTFAALALGTVMLVMKGVLRLSAEARAVLVALLGYVGVAAVSLVFGRITTTGAMTLSVFIGLFLFVLVSQSDSWQASLERFNKLVYVSALVLAAASMPLYFSALFSLGSIVLDPARWDPGIGYMLDRGRYLRFVGFAENPNFFALYTAPAFFMAVLSTRTGLGRLLGWFVVLSFVMTISLGMFLGAALALALNFLRSAGAGRKVGIFKVVRTGAIVLVVLYGLLAFTPFGDVFSHRVEYTGTEGRRELVSRAIEVAGGLSAFGEGLMYIDTTTDKFSHNTYIDVLVETGIVGLAFYLSALGLVSLLAFQVLGDRLAAPWALTWFAFLIHSGAHSLSYSPFLFLMVAVIIGRFTRLRAASRHARPETAAGAGGSMPADVQGA